MHGLRSVRICSLLSDAPSAFQKSQCKDKESHYCRDVAVSHLSSFPGRVGLQKGYPLWIPFVKSNLGPLRKPRKETNEKLIRGHLLPTSLSK